MVRLLECQQEAVDNEERTVYYSKEDLKAFAITILCYMLEIFETDISTSEMTELDLFMEDWRKQ